MKKMQNPSNIFDLFRIQIEKSIDFIVKITSYMLTHFLEFMELLDCELTIDNKDHIKKQFDHYISFIENGLSAN